MRYYRLLHGTRNALDAAAVITTLFGAWKPFWRQENPNHGVPSMEARKSSLPDAKIPGREFLASELSRLFTAVQSPSMSLETGLDHLVGELRTVVSSDYREARGLPSIALARELATVVETDVKPRARTWSSLSNSKRFSRAL